MRDYVSPAIVAKPAYETSHRRENRVRNIVFQYQHGFVSEGRGLPVSGHRGRDHTSETKAIGESAGIYFTGTHGGLTKGARPVYFTRWRI